MNRTALRNARGQINRLPCVFEQALADRNAVCSLTETRTVAARVVIACTSPLARAQCGRLAGLLREKSVFALKLSPTGHRLPAAATMRIHCGGLDGMRRVLDPQAPAPDVHRLVCLARERHGDLDAMPFSEIVRGVAAWKGRSRLHGEEP
jgi:hypothetical protein